MGPSQLEWISRVQDAERAIKQYMGDDLEDRSTNAYAARGDLRKSQNSGAHT